jgi:hypothetical protein
MYPDYERTMFELNNISEKKDITEKRKQDKKDRAAETQKYYDKRVNHEILDIIWIPYNDYFFGEGFILDGIEYKDTSAFQTPGNRYISKSKLQAVNDKINAFTDEEALVFIKENYPVILQQHLNCGFEYGVNIRLANNPIYETTRYSNIGIHIEFLGIKLFIDRTKYYEIQLHAIQDPTNFQYDLKFRKYNGRKTDPTYINYADYEHAGNTLIKKKQND